MKKTTLTIVLLSSFVLVTAQTKIIAHRGFSGVAPENTLIAFQKAIESGAEYFELDLHKSSDDSAMVIHDGSVNRTSSNGMKGKIVEMTYQDLCKVNVGYSDKFCDDFKDEKIPTLYEALAMAKGKIKVCIEIKAADLEKAVIETVNDLNMNDEVIIFAFDYGVLEKIRKLDKEIPILYLKTLATKQTIEKAKAINSTAIGVGGVTKVNKEFLETAHKQGIEVWRWTVDKEDDMKKLLDLGIDGIITNYPSKALEIRD